MSIAEYLEQAGCATAAQVAESTGLDLNHVSNTLLKLVQAGDAVRAKSSATGRRKWHYAPAPELLPPDARPSIDVQLTPLELADVHEWVTEAEMDVADYARDAIMGRLG